MIIEGMELKALQLEQENPYTMVRVSHTTNGVTYEARGWALWDGQQKWSNWEGQRIAVIRAKRKIAQRLEWEAGLHARLVAAEIEADRASGISKVIRATIVGVDYHHEIGGTVRL